MHPRIKQSPEDFVVEEIPLYPASGEGGHTFVWVEKRLRTTEQVARDLARAAGVRQGDVGYAGRKDRVAVTRQWLSVPGLDPHAALDLEIPGARVLEARRHPHKLRTGQLRANRFEVAVRGVAAEAAGRLTAAAERIRNDGFPNRFGEQRFGRAGDNAAAGARLLRGEGGPRDRREARFLLSALQAAVFNEVLAARPLPLGALEHGDVALRHETGGLFRVDDPAAEQPRADAFEISPTGPLFGRRPRPPLPTGEPARREAVALTERGIPDPGGLHPPRGISLRGGRRSLRIRPVDLRARAGPDVVWLGFTLPPGAYATVLIEALLGTRPDDSPTPEVVD